MNAQAYITIAILIIALLIFIYKKIPKKLTCKINYIPIVILIGLFSFYMPNIMYKIFKYSNLKFFTKVDSQLDYNNYLNFYGSLFIGIATIFVINRQIKESRKMFIEQLQENRDIEELRRIREIKGSYLYFSKYYRIMLVIFKKPQNHIYALNLLDLNFSSGKRRSTKFEELFKEMIFPIRGEQEIINDIYEINSMIEMHSDSIEIIKLSKIHLDNFYNDLKKQLKRSISDYEKDFELIGYDEGKGYENIKTSLSALNGYENLTGNSEKEEKLFNSIIDGIFYYSLKLNKIKFQCIKETNDTKKYQINFCEQVMKIQDLIFSLVTNKYVVKENKFEINYQYKLNALHNLIYNGNLVEINQQNIDLLQTKQQKLEELTKKIIENEKKLEFKYSN